MTFKNRRAAGQFLAAQLATYADRPDVIVLGLPRGGVPIAYEVAKALNAPLDVFLVRKLGVPAQEELALGAIATGGIRVINQDIVRSFNLTETDINRIAAKEQQELERREQLYRNSHAAPEVRQRTVILVDDGLATGATMRAAVLAVRRQHPEQIVVAVPVAAAETCREFTAIAEHIVCAKTPAPLMSVGVWYDNFSQTSDDEVRELLQQATRGEQRFFAGSSR